MCWSNLCSFDSIFIRSRCRILKIDFCFQVSFMRSVGLFFYHSFSVAVSSHIFYSIFFLKLRTTRAHVVYVKWSLKLTQRHTELRSYRICCEFQKIGLVQTTFRKPQWPIIWLWNECWRLKTGTRDMRHDHDQICNFLTSPFSDNS